MTDQPPVVESPAPDSYPANVTSFEGRKRATAQTEQADAAELVAAERGILGSMMLSTAAIADVTSTALSPTDFANPQHETIYRAALTLVEQGAPVDAVSVADLLAEQGDLRRVGSVTYLHELISSVVVTANAGYYANIVRERATLRKLVAAGVRIQQLGEAHQGGDVAHLVSAALSEAQYVADQLADATASTSTWQPVDVLTLDLDHVDEPTLCRRTDGIGLVYPGKVHTFVGEPESGKSWVADLAAAQEIQAGGMAAIIDYEDRPGPVVRRMLDLGCTLDELATRFRYIRPDVALTAAELPHLVQAVTGCGVVVIDGITEAMTSHGLSLSDNEDIARFLALLPRRIADLGPAVIQIDHVVKDEESRGRYAIGGQHKLAGIDGAQYKVITTVPFGKGKEGKANIVIDKDRAGGVRQHALGIKIAELVIDSRPAPGSSEEVGPLRVTLDAPSTGERTEAGGFRPTVLMRRVSDFVYTHPGSTTNEILEGVPGKKHHLRTAIRLLVEEAYVTTEDGPNRAKLHHSSAPFDDGSNPVGPGWVP